MRYTACEVNHLNMPTAQAPTTCRTIDLLPEIFLSKRPYVLGEALRGLWQSLSEKTTPLRDLDVT